MSYLTQSQQEGTFDVPLACPQSLIAPGDSIIVATIKLALDQKFRLRWLNLQVVGNVTTTDTARLNSGMGMCYAGIYCGEFQGINRPSGVPVRFLRRLTPGTSSFNPYHYQDFAGPDTLSLILVNNTTDAYIDACVTGSGRIFLQL